MNLKKLNKVYESEIEAMRDFYEILTTYHRQTNNKQLEINFSCNTDGRIAGTLFEFKLDITNLNAAIDQVIRYKKAFNAIGTNPPRYSYIIGINERVFYKVDHLNDHLISQTPKSWNSPLDFVLYEDVINGWIDEYSISGWNLTYCTQFNQNANKEEVKQELIAPSKLKINPFAWNKQLNKEKTDRTDNNWLTFNINLLGNSMLKKRLGAFFTPDRYVEVATKMVRDAIAKVPEGFDYIILDRCAGTGNLQKFLTVEELSHCVLNTYDYTEWTTLKGLYDERVRMIIPPTSESRDDNGLLKKGWCIKR